MNEYTDFDKMKKNLERNSDGDNELIFSFLKDMLHKDKRSRKLPKDLLSHPFIQLGEKHIEEEKERLNAQGMF